MQNTDESSKRLGSATAVVFTMFMAIMFGGVAYVFAANTSNQTAATTSATTISVVGKVADTAITTVSFPEGAPSATISNPYNDVDTVSDAQFLSATVSEPVVRLKNTSGGSLNVILEITTWNGTDPGFVSSEDYEMPDTSSTNISTVTKVLSSDGGAASKDTTTDSFTAIGAGAYKALYLELNLGSLASKTGSSTLTILGETP